MSTLPTPPVLPAHCVLLYVLYVTLGMGVTAAVWVHEGEAALRWHLPLEHFVNLYALCRGHTQINLRNPETDHVK